MIPLPFTVDAAAVPLPVQGELLGDVNTLLPSFPEVRIEKLNIVLFPEMFAKFPDCVVFLIFAVEERRSECVETETGRFRRGYLQSGGITVKAAFIGLASYRPEEFLQTVFIPIDDFQFNHCGILSDRLQSFTVLQIGVDVMVEEKPGHLAAA